MTWCFDLYIGKPVHVDFQVINASILKMGIGTFYHMTLCNKFKFKLFYCTIMFYTAKLSLTHHMAISLTDHSLSSDQILTLPPQHVTPCIITYNIKQTQLKIRHTFIWISVYWNDMIWSVPLQLVKLFILLQKVFQPTR